MRIILYIVNILIATILILFSEESSAAYWLGVIKFSPLQTFIVVSVLGFCAIFFFWNKVYEKLLRKIENWQEDKHIPGKKFPKKILLKIARWIVRKYNYFEKHKYKKIVKRIRAWKLLGLYLGGLAPFCFHAALCAQKIFIQSRLGFLCVWLGATTRLAIEIFAGLKLIDWIF